MAAHTERPDGMGGTRMTKRHRRKTHTRLPARVRRREDGRTALEVGGVVQSVLLPPLDETGATVAGADLGYWAAMLPPDTGVAPQRALLLGLGGGTVAALLARRYPGIQMVGIESDPGVLAAARSDIGLDTIPGLSVVCADAFAWVGAAVAGERAGYDYIALDLYLAGRLVAGSLARDYLEQLAMLLAPDGELAVNLMVTARTNDQLLRLRQVLRLAHTQRVRGNIVAHLRGARERSSADPEGPGRVASAGPRG